MPKIDAPTVVEHHENRRAALIAAATQLLADGGIDAVTPGAVGAAAGLARSSVYQYFDSTPALLASVVEDVMPRELDRMRAALATVGTPSERLDTYIRYLLESGTDTTHRSMSALRGGALPEECQARIRELHQEQYAPLRQALTDLGVVNPILTSSLVLGIVEAGTQAVLHGTDRDAVVERTISFVHNGIKN